MAKSNSLTFRGVRFSQDALTIVAPPEAPPFCRLNFRSDLSRPVLKAMEWDTGKGLKSGGLLGGELNGISMTLVPSSATLKDRSLELAVSTVDKFKLVVVKTNGEITGYELSFQVRSRQEDTAAAVFMYVSAVGNEKAQLKITFTKEPKLSCLSLDDPAEGENGEE
jgi:hypothetical protein